MQPNGPPYIADQVLELRTLETGSPGITAAFGAFLAEAAAVCLEDQRHTPGVTLIFEEHQRQPFQLTWSPVTDQQRRCHNDQQVATEHGAYGIAILVMKRVTGKSVMERSRKGTGFDYWLGDQSEGLFQGKARLEVSGILHGSMSRIDARVRAKSKQTEVSDGSFPAYIAVIEFRRPLAKVIRR